MLNNLERHQLLKLAMIYSLCLFFFNWLNGVLPHQLANAPIFDISIDNSFWIFHLSGMPSYLIQQPYLLSLLELILVVLMILICIKEKRIYVITFLILALLLNLLQQTYSNTLTKTSVILPIVLLPFCFKKDLFAFVWKFPRYYLVYLMVTAALFKMINGGLFHTDQMTNIIANQHLDLAYFQSNHISKIISNLIGSNAVFATISYVAVFVIELSFMTLIFTKKLDRGFFFLLLFFCTSIYLAMRINTLDIVYLALPLLPFSTKND